MIDTRKLTKELQAAGIKISGCNSNGIVWAEDGTTEIQDRKDVKTIIAKHDPTPEPQETIEERLKKVEAELATYKAKVDKIKG
jgi:hypothetical protein